MPILIAIGDSITYGNWDHNGGWVARLREYIDQKNLQIYQGDDLYSHYYALIYNLGIPGDTTTGVLNRLESELAPRINRELDNILIIAIGINDSRYYEHLNAHATSFSQYQENLPTLFAKAKQYTDKIVFVGLTPVDEKRTDPLYWETQAFYRNEFIQKYDQELQKFCQQEGIHFIEVFSKMSRLDVASLMEDGIHPNDQGYQLLFEIIKQGLEEQKFL